MTNQPTDKRDELSATPRDDAQPSDVGDIVAWLESIAHHAEATTIRQLSADNAALREAASELLAWYGPFNPTRHPPEINGAWLRLEAALSALPAQPCDKLVEALTVYASPNFWNEKHPELEAAAAGETGTGSTEGEMRRRKPDAQGISRD